MSVCPEASRPPLQPASGRRTSLWTRSVFPENLGWTTGDLGTLSCSQPTSRGTSPSLFKAHPEEEPCPPPESPSVWLLTTQAPARPQSTPPPQSPADSRAGVGGTQVPVVVEGHSLARRVGQARPQPCAVFSQLWP